MTRNTRTQLATALRSINRQGISIQTLFAYGVICELRNRIADRKADGIEYEDTTLQSELDEYIAHDAVTDEQAHEIKSLAQELFMWEV